MRYFDFVFASFIAASVTWPFPQESLVELARMVAKLELPLRNKQPDAAGSNATVAIQQTLSF
jgi:hypothetical protein